MTQCVLEPFAPDVLAVLDVARRVPTLQRTVQDRLLSRLEATLGLPGGSGGGGAGGGAGDPSTGEAAASRGSATSAGAAVGRTAPFLARPLPLALAMFTMGAGAGAGLYALLTREPAPQQAVTYAPLVARPPEPAKPLAVVAQAPATVDARATSPPSKSPQPGGQRSARGEDPSGHDAELATERAALEIARTALRRGDATQARAALGLHERDFPRAKLVEEREALWVLALVSGGQAELARARARAFRRRFPRSLFAPVLDEAMRSIPPRAGQSAPNAHDEFGSGGAGI